MYVCAFVCVCVCIYLSEFFLLKRVLGCPRTHDITNIYIQIIHLTLTDSVWLPWPYASRDTRVHASQNRIGNLHSCGLDGNAAMTDTFQGVVLNMDICELLSQNMDKAFSKYGQSLSIFHLSKIWSMDRRSEIWTVHTKYGIA